MSWLLLSLRRLRQGRLAFAGLAGLVFVTALVAGSLPRLFTEVTTDSIHGAVAALAPADRNVELDQVDTGGAAGPMAAYDDSLEDVAGKAAKLRASFPAPLPSVLGPSTYIIETPSYEALDGTALAAELRLRIMQDVEQHVRYVAGRAPSGRVGTAPDLLHSESGSGAGSGGSAPATVPQLEVGVSAAAARKLGLEVGSSIFVGPLTALDPLAGGTALSVKVVGIYEPMRAGDPYWVDDPQVLGWRLREFSLNVTYVQSTFLLSPEAYPDLLATDRQGFGQSATPAPRRISWRFPAEPGRIAPQQLASLVNALRRLEVTYAPGNGEGYGPVVTTRLLGRLVALQQPWAAAQAALTVAGLGAAAVALATLALVVALTADQRRRALLLQRERGASARQAVLASLLEAGLLAIPAAALGAILAIRLTPQGGLLRTGLAGPAAVALLTMALFLLVVWRTVLGSPQAPGRPVVAGRRPPPRRLVFEGLAAVVAIFGAVTLRDRGLPGSGAAAVTGAAGVVEPTTVVGTGGPDPFLVLVPVLVGLAVGLLALRLVPLPMAGLARLVGRRRDLGPVLAVRRAARELGASRVLLIVLATTTLGSFASATIVDLGHTADLQAWQDVGAAYRVDPSPDPLAGIPALPSDLVPDRLPGVTAAATAFVGPVALSGGGAAQLLVALDPAAYDRVTAGTPAAVDWPAAMLRPASADLGSADDPLPAVVAALGQTSGGPALDGTLQIVIGSRTVSIRAVALQAGFPGLPADRPFVILSRPQVDAAVPGSLRQPTTAYVRAPSGDRAAIAAALAQVAPETTLVSQAASASSLADQPVVRVVSAGLIALVGLALLYAALAVVASIVLAASQRAGEVAHLSIMGLSQTQARRALFVEYGPPVLLAVLAGLALGLGLFAFVEPGLGLELVLGVAQAASPSLDPGLVGLLVVLIGAILVLGVALGAPAQRRAAAEAVRRGLG